jgi:VIT1/CCC1 family predicted Fe2+/Mn2+ transporter
MRQKLVQLPDPGRPRLTRHDAVGAIGIFLLCFLSTFPIVVPFILVSNARLALRISNLVACAMLLVCGYSFGHYSGFRPWAMGLAMVGVGGALIGVAVLLGG